MPRPPIPLWKLLKLELPVYLSRTTSYARACVKPEYRKEYQKREMFTFLDARIKTATGEVYVNKDSVKTILKSPPGDFTKEPPSSMLTKFITSLGLRGKKK